MEIFLQQSNLYPFIGHRCNIFQNVVDILCSEFSPLLMTCLMKYCHFTFFLITHYCLDIVIRCWSRCKNYGYRYRSGKATQVNIPSNKVFMCCLVGLKVSALGVPFFLFSYLKFYYSAVEIIATSEMLSERMKSDDTQ